MYCLTSLSFFDIPLLYYDIKIKIINNYQSIFFSSGDIYFCSGPSICISLSFSFVTHFELFCCEFFQNFVILRYYTIKSQGNICFDEEILKVSPRCLSSSSSEDIVKTSSRRLDQDEYICFKQMSSEDVFKTCSRRLVQDQFICLENKPSRRLQDVFKTFSSRIQDVLQNLLQDFFKTCSRHVQDVFKVSSRCLPKMYSTHLQYVFKTF